MRADARQNLFCIAYAIIWRIDMQKRGSCRAQWALLHCSIIGYTSLNLEVSIFKDVFENRYKI